MPPTGDQHSLSGQRAAAMVGRSVAALVRERLAADRSWHSFTEDQRRWVCLWCLSAVARRPQRNWEDSIATHLEGCRHFGGGRFAQQPAASVQAQLSFENMVSRVESDPAWQVFDAQGAWVCPACLERIPNARLVQGARNTLTYRGMALHLQRCPVYARGVLNAPPVVRAARDRPAGAGNTRQTSALSLPLRTPTGSPAAGSVPGVRPPSAALPAAIPVDQSRPSSGPHPIATPVSGAPVARPLVPPVAQVAPPVARPVSSNSPAGMPQVPPVAQPLGGTGSHLRSRRFVTPAPEAVVPPPAAPAQPHGEGFTWMDDADAAAGAIVREEQPHLERSDLLRARDLQKKMLAEAPQLPGYRFATRYEPCDHVSGDFFSFIRLLDGRLGFAIGDVSGHGMQAGLVMSMAKKTLEIYGELIGDPAEVLAKVNDAIAGDLGGKMFVSMTYAILSPSERTIAWARAGHNPTLVRNIHEGETSEIKPPGMVVGMKAGQVFRDSLQVETTVLRSGDIFLLYTDGVTEMTNSRDEEFESDRLREVLERCGPDGPDALLTQIMDRVRHFRGSKPVADDITLLALAVE